jgi:hypothetical protein
MDGSGTLHDGEAARRSISKKGYLERLDDQMLSLWRL